MYIIDYSNCYYSEEEIQNYILNMNAFEVLQNIDSAFDDIMNNENWFINRLKFELLWEEYISLRTVLNELEQRNELYIHGASCDKNCKRNF